jgi:hypothetical protein
MVNKLLYIVLQLCFSSLVFCSRINVIFLMSPKVLGSIVVSIPACHAGDRGPIPRRGDFFIHLRLL